MPRDHLVNPSTQSFGVGVMAPAWLSVLAAASGSRPGDSRIAGRIHATVSPDEAVERRTAQAVVRAGADLIWSRAVAGFWSVRRLGFRFVAPAGDNFYTMTSGTWTKRDDARMDPDCARSRCCAPSDPPDRWNGLACRRVFLRQPMPDLSDPASSSNHGQLTSTARR